MNQLKSIFFLCLFCGTFIGCNTQNKENQEDVLSYVDPFIGTGAHGHTFPGATRPNAMVQVGPDTHLLGWEASSGYSAADSLIYAFSHTHLSGTGIGDMGDVALLPYSGVCDTVPVASFSKRSEEASPGYYRVHLHNFNVNVELTSTPRVGLHRYTFADIKERKVMLNLAHILQPNWGHKVVGNHYEQVDEFTLRGSYSTQGWAHHHKVYYYIRFSEPILSTQQWVNGAMQQEAVQQLDTKEAVQFYYHFAEANRPLLVKVGLSLVDLAGAEKNMHAELSHWDFNKVRAEARADWLNELKHITIESTDEVVKRIFYTAMYHTMMAPCNYQDVDGRYFGIDKKIHRTHPSEGAYTVFSLWDTFRAFHPLMTIIRPEDAVKWGKTLVRDYETGGCIPRWSLVGNYTGCMVGTPAMSVLADLVTKNMITEDLNLWATAAAKSSVYNKALYEKFKGTREARLMAKQLLLKDKYNYIPCDEASASVSWGVEMAYEDWCVSQIAKAAGQSELAKEFAEKSKAYTYYLDPETKMMRGRCLDGSWRTPFNPYYSSHTQGDYTEGNAFQWSFFVPHDMDAYIAKLGGKKVLETRLDTLFTTSSQIDGAEASSDITGLIGQYAHGNEPSHHMAYLYNWTDAPWKGQERLDFILRNFYTDQPEGIIGNEDCGQMSAWYVMSAMGFYQVCPGKPLYTIGRPILDKAVIHLAKTDFEIEVKNNAIENKYVKEAFLNGERLDDLTFSHEAIVKGGRLVIVMSSEKN